MYTTCQKKKKKKKVFNISCPDQSWLFNAVACRRVGPPWSRQADCCSTWTPSSNLSWSHSCHGAAAQSGGDSAQRRATLQKRLRRKHLFQIRQLRTCLWARTLHRFIYCNRTLVAKESLRCYGEDKLSGPPATLITSLLRPIMYFPSIDIL